jgi:hypothetical protein
MDKAHSNVSRDTVLQERLSKLYSSPITLDDFYNVSAWY